MVANQSNRNEIRIHHNLFHSLDSKKVFGMEWARVYWEHSTEEPVNKCSHWTNIILRVIEMI